MSPTGPTQLLSVLSLPLLTEVSTARIAHYEELKTMGSKTVAATSIPKLHFEALEVGDAGAVAKTRRGRRGKSLRRRNGRCEKGIGKGEWRRRNGRHGRRASEKRRSEKSVKNGSSASRKKGSSVSARDGKESSGRGRTGTEDEDNAATGESLINVNLLKQKHAHQCHRAPNLMADWLWHNNDGLIY